MSNKIQVVKIQKQHCDNNEVDTNHENEREEEEALSLCDLPISNVIGENEDKQEENQITGDDLDFDFGSLITALEAEMCSADEVFSGGQILPFRHSVSSEAGLSRYRNSSWRSVSRSESMERSGSCSRSSSTRSSSIRSQYSTTSSSSSLSTSSNKTSNSIKTIPLSKTKVRNNFHSHPSPKPQVWTSSTQSTAYVTPTGRKSSMWEVLKLGLVRTPEIELQDLKQRHRTSFSSKPFILPRSNSISSTSSNRSNKNNNGTSSNSTISDLLLELQNRKIQAQNNKSSGGFFKSCKCSVMAIEPLPTREVGTITKSGGYLGPKMSSVGKFNQVNLNEDKSLEQNLMGQEQQQQQQMKQQQEKKDNELRQGKKVMSHHRTFEWLRDLSHASVLNS